MVTERERQERALKRAQQIIAEAEKKRAATQTISGLEDFISGSFEIFHNEDNVHNLARYLDDLYTKKGFNGVEDYLNKLEKGSQNSEKIIRERSVHTLALFANIILLKNDVKVVVKIQNILTNWLKNESSSVSNFGVICKQLQEIGKYLLENKYWKEIEPLLTLLYQIQNGIVEKSSSVQGLVVKMQENLASKHLLQSLTTAFLDETNPQKSEAESLLTYLGRRSVIFLLNKLMHSDSKNERIALIKLIPYAGNTAVPVLVECLKQNPPWFVIRNVIFIVSEIGDSSLFSMVRPYMSHRDIRVQQQVISCIAKFGGNRKKNRLLEALPLLHDEIKSQLVMELGQMEGDDVELALIELLENRHAFSNRIYENLVKKLCISLKYFPSDNSAEILNEIIEEAAEKGGGVHSKILMIAQDSLSVIEPKIRHSRKNISKDEDFVSFTDDPVDEQTKKNNVREIEDKIFAMIEEDDLEKACQYLFNQIRILAREKDFPSAEYLRDKLLEINPMALNEVIEAGELIENEKSSSITNHHVEVWSDLYESMTTEEFNAMYYAMSLQSYAPGEVLVKAGETDPSLYFINSGNVSLSCAIGGSQQFLKRLQPAEIIGMGQFFNVSVWTISIEANSECQVSVLERSVFDELVEKFPGLDDKLEKFCLKFNVVPELIKMSGGDRREFPRYSVSVIVTSMLLDPYGNPGKRSFKGELLDISQGGLCFSINISSKENSRLLLGRQILCEIKTKNEELVRTSGAIVGVQYKDREDKDFSVHVKFHSKLEQSSVMQVVNLMIK